MTKDIIELRKLLVEMQGYARAMYNTPNYGFKGSPMDIEIEKVLKDTEYVKDLVDGV